MLKILPAMHFAASTDILRPAMCHVHIKNGLAVATNGHVLVLVNLYYHSMLERESIKTLEGKFIHADVWRLLCTAESITCTETEIVAKRGHVIAGYRYAIEEMQYPDYMRAVNELAGKTPIPTDVLGIDPALVDMVRKVFGTKELEFKIYGRDRGMMVRPEARGKQFAILMPRMNYGDIEEFNHNIEGEKE